jgi:hypothetical protein
MVFKCKTFSPRFKFLHLGMGEVIKSVSEPELQGAASFGRSRSRNGIKHSRNWKITQNVTVYNPFSYYFLVKNHMNKIVSTSVAEPEPQGAASFGRSRSPNAIRLRLRRLKLRQWYYT